MWPDAGPESSKVRVEGAEFDFVEVCRNAHAKAERGAEAIDLAGALGAGLDIVRQVDQYINVTAPFKLAKTIDADPTAKARLGVILYNCAESLRVAAILLSPAMPEKMGALLRSWSCEPAAGARLADLCAFGGSHALRAGQRVAKGEILFQRANPADPAP